MTIRGSQDERQVASIAYKENQDDQYDITNVSLFFNDGWQTKES